jgi:hypothetical protein
MSQPSPDGTNGSGPAVPVADDLGEHIRQRFGHVLPPLEAVTCPDRQARADELAPIGWCNLCVAEAAAAKASGGPAQTIHAGVTMIPLAQQVMVPGAGVQWTVIAVPACTARHITAQRNSGLTGSGLIPGL